MMASAVFLEYRLLDKVMGRITPGMKFVQLCLQLPPGPARQVRESRIPKGSIYCPLKDSGSKNNIPGMLFWEPESLTGQYMDPLGNSTALLRNLIFQVTIIQRPYYLQYIHIMVT